VLPYFKRLERRVGECDDTYRGRDGSLTVTTMDWNDPLCEAFMEGAVSLGIPRNPDYNGAIQEGVSYCQRTIQNGLRVSAATAFLHPARKRGNVDVRTHAHVTNIIFEGKRAVGVRYLRGGKGGTPVEVRASKEVILSGGAYNSPQVLQLSGVGSPDLLQSHGIEVRHALPGVGEGLQDHYAPRSVARVKNIRTINEIRRGVSLWVEALKWATTRRGLLSLSPTMVYCFWHSGEIQGRRAGPARGRARHDGGLLAAAARKPRLCPDPLGRSVRAADHPDQLSRRGDRPPRRRRRHEAGAPAARVEAARALLRL
jgi:choline dehydrogenase